jgi:hypothetical protein
MRLESEAMEPLQHFLSLSEFFVMDDAVAGQGLAFVVCPDRLLNGSVRPQREKDWDLGA